MGHDFHTRAILELEEVTGCGEALERWSNA